MISPTGLVVVAMICVTTKDRALFQLIETCCYNDHEIVETSLTGVTSILLSVDATLGHQKFEYYVKVVTSTTLMPVRSTPFHPLRK